MLGSVVQCHQKEGHQLWLVPGHVGLVQSSEVVRERRHEGTDASLEIEKKRKKKWTELERERESGDVSSNKIY